MPGSRRYVVALALLVACAGRAEAQTSRADPTDLQTWLGSTLQVGLTKNLDAAVQYRLRMVDNGSSYRGSYVTGELGYELNKHFSTFASYRLALLDDGSAHRFAVGAEASVRLARVALSVRPRVQYQQQNPAEDDEPSDKNTYFRTRAQLKYSVTKRLDAYASIEPYFDFSADYPIDNLRNTAGVRYEYASNKKVDLFYIYRPDFAKSYNRTFHIIGVDFDFGFKR